ncbi:MAG TPA: symmetrical bis(5'-nucleosyl)-tetraphosphatase, partial [Agitococcus sp.]|nr:symmetrical bis(5'-nucleosyl)-tetraphosphatase [Agitococcus sp.]
FDPQHDCLWFAGDLVARGSDSLAVLRRVKALGSSARVVLGNHDLHLIACFYGYSIAKKKDRTANILTASDGQELINWLRHQPLFLDIPHQQAVISHAGIPPCWNLTQARTLASEVSQVLKNEVQLHQFLGGMYGNSPALWHEHLRGAKRWRVITNYLTRMRLCNLAGELEFSHKEGLDDLPDGYYPWFNLPNPSIKNTRILFGHWAALEGNGPQAPIIALDGGCVWGGQLLAYRLDDGRFFSATKACIDCGLE